jgi:hypothetical protein
MGYKEKFEMLRPWIKSIVGAVKKDLKQEHLKIDQKFCKRYFLGKNALNVTTAEMATAYDNEIAEGNVGLGEFIASRWVLNNREIYDYFEEKLNKLTPNFDEIAALPEGLSQNLMQGAIKQFGAVNTYLFCILNSVVFPESLLKELRSLAEEEEKKPHVPTKKKR